MENKINIAELLKDCPKGTELYSPLCGECKFDRIHQGTIICKKQNSQEITFTSDGYYMLPVFENCEQMLFPSKENRDWSTFQRPFKDGDIITCTNVICPFTAIFKERVSESKFNRYAVLTLDKDPLFKTNMATSDFSKPRFATDEEKQKLFDAIKTMGHKWNAETKTLEKLVKPKFKVGDKIVNKKLGLDSPTLIKSVSDEYYGLELPNGIGVMSVKEQDDYELVPNKFDISTLKPFDKVLVRDNNEQKWTADLFSLFDKNLIYPYSCVGHYTNQCIPYEGNEHLLGKIDNCDDYYKTWEN